MTWRFFSPFFLFLLFSFVLLKTPSDYVLALRGGVASFLSPLWRSGDSLSKGVANPLNQVAQIGRLKESYEELEKKLQWQTLENALLKEEVLKLSSATVEKMSSLFSYDSFELSPQEALVDKMKAKGLIGRVIYRPPTTWSSCLWINLGEEHNSSHTHPIVAVDSPVTCSDALIGVVDYVGKKQSRVRLITDSSMVVPVKACRGKRTSQFIADKLRELQLFCTTDLASSLTESEKQQVFASTDALIQKLHQNTQSHYFAKGELRGKSLPFGLSSSPLLEGSGFNYDFGESFFSSSSSPTAPLLQKGDLLVTSGLDGFLPGGLKVALIHTLTPPVEGAYHYELQALPAAGFLNELSTITVLPPLISIDLEREEKKL